MDSPHRAVQLRALIAALAVAAPAAAAEGVVVDDVGQGGAAARAGARPGDVLVDAEVEAGRAIPLASPFDLLRVAVEDGLRGPVALRGSRAGAPLRLVLNPGSQWKLLVRPTLPPAIAEAWARALEKKDVDALGAAAEALPADLWLERASLWFRAGQVAADARSWPKAEAAYAYAREVIGARSAPATAIAWAWEARSFEQRNDLASAERLTAQAVAAARAAGPDGMQVADLLNQLALIKANRGDLPGAEETHQTALRIREALAPESIAVAATLNNLGTLAERKGDVDAAEKYHRRAYAIRERVAPDSLDLASSLSNLGNISWYRGDLRNAEEMHRRAAAIQERLVPDSLPLAGTVNNLGVMALSRGDLAAAEAQFQRALQIYAARAADSSMVLQLENNLGLVLMERGDLRGAEQRFRRALALVGDGDPDSQGEPLHNLGEVARLRNDLDTAEQFYRQSLAAKRTRNAESFQVAGTLGEIANVLRAKGKLDEAGRTAEEVVQLLRRLAPGGADLATALMVRGSIHEDAGERADARRCYEEALRLYEQKAPGSPNWARASSKLGALAMSAGAAAEAKTRLERARKVFAALAPGSAYEAETHHDLGRLARQQGNLGEARVHFGRAIDALEAQVGRLGGADEVRSGFAAQYRSAYRDYVETLVELGRTDEAFQGVERYRARNFLAMLAERDLSFAQDLPADLLREWRAVEAEYVRTQSELTESKLSGKSKETARLVAVLRDLRGKRAAVLDRVRAASPRVGALRQPAPLSAKAAAAALAPGTVMLSYLVGDARTELFVVSGSTTRVLTLAIGERALAEQVERLRRAIQEQRDIAAIADPAHALYRELIAPAAAYLNDSQRLLILPDGPLHRLPFAALVRTLDGGRPEYLVEWRPIHTALSATVYAELARGAPSSRDEATVVAFGDPALAGRSGLPHARHEVEAIAALFGERASAFVGAEATEERAKGEARRARYLHFATHGLLDEGMPINSGIVLSGGGNDDGVLQAWEVMEQLRLDADLVVLSGCETAIGQELGGEGLAGLARAFHFSGARSVLASLWAVEDGSTAELMTRFYRNLKAGQSKDEALRSAQLDLIRGAAPVAVSSARAIGGLAPGGGERSANAAHPFQWAAFQLLGDWR